jgi:hypothetical protein
MAHLDVEIAAYRSQLFDLESNFRGKWTLFRGAQRIDIYDTFEMAADDAVKRFGSGPYLIRQIGAPPITLPICVITRGEDDGSSMRL